MAHLDPVHLGMDAGFHLPGLEGLEPHQGMIACWQVDQDFLRQFSGEIVLNKYKKFTHF